MLKSVLQFVFDNIVNPLSSEKIADTMTSDGRKTYTKTVEKYLKALAESYIIYRAKRYNIKGKQYLKTMEKYYVVNIGLRFMLLRSKQIDAGISRRMWYIWNFSAGDMMYMWGKSIPLKLILSHRAAKEPGIIRLPFPCGMKRRWNGN